MNKKYVKTKIKSNDNTREKEIIVNNISEKNKIQRMTSLFRENGNNMFEYNKLRKKIEENFQRDDEDKNDLFASDYLKEKKINDWINFKDQIKKEKYLLEKESLRNNQKEDEEEEEEKEDQEKNKNSNEINQTSTEKQNFRPEENFYNKNTENNNESNQNIKHKKQLRVLNTNDIQNILKNSEGRELNFHFENGKNIEENKSNNYNHLIKRKANLISNNVILIKPQIVSSEKQKFFQKSKNNEQKENQLMFIMSNNDNDILNKKAIENKLKEFHSKIDNMKERNEKKVNGEGINLPLVNQWKKSGVMKEEYMNVYAENFEEKVKDFEKSKKHESNLSKSVLQNQSVITENKNIGCFDRFIKYFSPDQHFLEAGHKKHNWYGKHGAFDPKFQDNREYRD